MSNDPLELSLRGRSSPPGAPSTPHPNDAAIGLIAAGLRDDGEGHIAACVQCTEQVERLRRMARQHDVEWQTITETVMSLGWRKVAGGSTELEPELARVAFRETDDAESITVQAQCLGPASSPSGVRVTVAGTGVSQLLSVVDQSGRRHILQRVNAESASAEAELGPEALGASTDPGNPSYELRLVLQRETDAV
jgi:hypothetical protein